MRDPFLFVHTSVSSFLLSQRNMMQYASCPCLYQTHHHLIALLLFRQSNESNPLLPTYNASNPFAPRFYPFATRSTPPRPQHPLGATRNMPHSSSTSALTGSSAAAATSTAAAAAPNRPPGSPAPPPRSSAAVGSVRAGVPSSSQAAKAVDPSPPRPISFLQYLFGEAPRPPPAAAVHLPAAEPEPEGPKYEVGII